eukprot:TRINITY_DN2178_c0_g5_i1.p1 TRINITY_DN2178_c0_g5~~TRINITY_DN2178_c0_g5_i1.p1  ORF type:complete len:555 (-),score=128.85 TRINITY_DN2178_c0_g5_i1:188-1852(-)
MSEQSLPIDILAPKVIDWLLDRRKLPQNWRKNLQVIRALIEKAKPDLLKNSEIQHYLEKVSTINYFHALEIFELLVKSGESEAKTLFGYYANPKLQAWNQIIRAYEKDNIYLGEISQSLLDILTYDIPNLRAAIEENNKAIAACNKHENELKKNINSSRYGYNQKCKEYQIAGEHPREEIMAKVKDLDIYFDEIVQLLKNDQILLAMEYFKDFSGFVSSIGNQKKKKKNQNVSQPENTFEIMSYLIQYGDETKAKMKSRLNPDLQVAAVPEREDEKEKVVKLSPKNEHSATQSSIEIDWSILDSNNPTLQDDSGIVPIEIKWENGTSTEIDWADTNTDGIEIADQNTSVTDHGIELASEPLELDNEGNLIGGKTVEEKVQKNTKNDDNETILGAIDTHNKFLSELQLLFCFLNQRIIEMEKQNIGLDITKINIAPQSVQNKEIPDVKRMLKSLQLVIDAAKSKKVTHLFEIKSSPKYVDRLIFSLDKDTLDIVNFEIALKENAVKREQTKDNSEQLKPKIDECKSEMKVIRKQIEEGISKLFNNRGVNLMIPNV